MRLIDLDSLPNYKLMGIITFEGEKSPAELRIVLWEDIESMPIVDAVPVVRCRDCKWFNHYTMECESDDVATDHEGGASFSINFGPDDFCSYGQRKEDDHD